MISTHDFICVFRHKHATYFSTWTYYHIPVNEGGLVNFVSATLFPPKSYFYYALYFYFRLPIIQAFNNFFL